MHLTGVESTTDAALKSLQSALDCLVTGISNYVLMFYSIIEYE